MSREFDLVIVGAGIVGAAAASLAAARKLCPAARIALVADRFAAQTPAADAQWDLRVFALSRASERLLRLADVWERIPAARRCAYERMSVWDAGGEPGGRGSLGFDAAEIGEANLGHIVDAGQLQHHSLQAARAAGVVMIEAGIASFTALAQEARLGLHDGRELRCQLVVGADGTDSKLRELLQIGTAGHSYHQDALVAHVRTALPHRRTAWQRFLPTGPLALLPLTDGRSSLVWTLPRGEAARVAALDAAAFGAALTEASAAALGACELTTPVASFPLKLQYAERYADARAVLVGDAAHVVHPLAGQGLNLGLLDCAALFQILGETGDVRACGDLKPLRRYERWRRSENLLAAGAFDGLERLFSNANPGLQVLRSAGLGTIGRIAPARREFARRALGLSGDVPALLTGGRS
jgi:ubiquinone biosynthesis UbiH/UbiF/VisC/COQ6 family hydroxylase